MFSVFVAQAGVYIGVRAAHCSPHNWLRFTGLILKAAEVSGHRRGGCPKVRASTLHLCSNAVAPLRRDNSAERSKARAYSAIPKEGAWTRTTPLSCNRHAVCMRTCTPSSSMPARTSLGDCHGVSPGAPRLGHLVPLPVRNGRVRGLKISMSAARLR